MQIRIREYSQFLEVVLNKRQALLEQLGITVGKAILIPEDPYTRQRQEIDELKKRSTDVRKPDPLKKFLDNERKVLRFFVVWDDTSSPHGDLRKFVRFFPFCISSSISKKLHYFLADDTVEVVEELTQN